jgi:hypothetical protein
LAQAYFAPAARQPRVDFGFEYLPEQYEARQQFERGFQEYMNLARRPQAPFFTPPLGQVPPEYAAYYAQMRQLQALYPEHAAELAQQAAIVGHMADLRRSRRLRMRPPPMAGNGYSYYTPLPVPPGFTAAEAATIGAPVRYWNHAPTLPIGY